MVRGCGPRVGVVGGLSRAAVRRLVGRWGAAGGVVAGWVRHRATRVPAVDRRLAFARPTALPIFAPAAVVAVP